MNTIDKYNELIRQGKYDEAAEIQKSAMGEAMQYVRHGMDLDDAMQKAGFYKSDELQTILDNVISKAKEKNPYFPHTAPFADIEKDDETLDDIFECDKYDIKPCLFAYYKELKQFEVDVLFAKTTYSIQTFIRDLDCLCKFISENTHKPLHLENKIIDFLQGLNKAPGFGQVLQILILKGILKWFEVCNINENDLGYTQAAELCAFVEKRFIDVCVFYFMYFNKDENSRQLDNYLATDEIYKLLLTAPNDEPVNANDEAKNEPQQIELPENVLKWLQETICSNGKPFIEDATLNTHLWNWLQNKELARILLTHDKIKGSFTVVEVERQTPKLFFYPKENEPLELANPKKRKGDIVPPDIKTLTKFLANL